MLASDCASIWAWPKPDENPLYGASRSACAPGRLDEPKVLSYQVPTAQTNEWEDFMGIDTSGGHPAMDYAEHNRTYKNFLAWTKIGIVSSVVLLAGMAYFLV